MEQPKTYCDYVINLEENNVHRVYHDREYGFPIDDDNLLFERLVLEINQAGLSWATILNKKENFRKAYKNFDIKKVAKFNDKDYERLMNDAGIIRNRLKINAAVHNANVILALQKEHGSFKAWLDSNYRLDKNEWTKLFKKTFKFTGGEIVNEFLMSSGYLRGAHAESCPVHAEIITLKPMWRELNK